MSERHELDAKEIRRLFGLLDEELGRRGIHGEVYVVGGAVMCLAYAARPATQDVDAWFRPARDVRDAARRVAPRAGVPADWLNDAVKGFLGDRGTYHSFLELPHLRVLVATPEYLLAMKCLSMRIGAEFRDLDDVRYLLRYLNIEDYDAAREVIGRFYPLDRFPQKTLYALAELLGDAS